MRSRYPRLPGMCGTEDSSGQSHYQQNSVIRHATKKHKVFQKDESVKKVVWLAIQAALQKWTMPLRDWRRAMSRFIIEFGDRLDGNFWSVRS